MSEANTLKKLNIGCGRRPIAGFVNLDIMPDEGVDVVFDLETCGKEIPDSEAHEAGPHYYQLPFVDNTFDRILCSHTMEHIHNFLPVMQELWRVAKPGCSAVFLTPYGGHDSAFEDPTHVRHFFSKSWLYASQYVYGGADYGYRGDWGCARLIFRCEPSMAPPDGQIEAHIDEILDAIKRMRNFCIEMTAELIAVKPARIAGFGDWTPRVEINFS